MKTEIHGQETATEDGLYNNVTTTKVGTKRGTDINVLTNNGNSSKSSEGNSTTIPLGIGETFTGTGEQNDFVADTVTNNATVNLRFSLREYKRN